MMRARARGQNRTPQLHAATTLWVVTRGHTRVGEGICDSGGAWARAARGAVRCAGARGAGRAAGPQAGAPPASRAPVTPVGVPEQRAARRGVRAHGGGGLAARRFGKAAEGGGTTASWQRSTPGAAARACVGAGSAQGQAGKGRGAGAGRRREAETRGGKAPGGQACLRLGGNEQARPICPGWRAAAGPTAAGPQSGGALWRLVGSASSCTGRGCGAAWRAQRVAVAGPLRTAGGR